ncbi:hypothetical protein [Mesorhizobium sp.]|uniref:hypothetical protein n=1 Tax=Mesorhizobium sp. TaxID=1871066 RepID=UPI0025BDFE47|nr:hypothetical protein [Mesorhizobium sp.]
MKGLWIVLLLACLATGCAAHSHGSYGNRDYTNTSFQAGGANQDIILSGQYVSPHSF